MAIDTRSLMLGNYVDIGQEHADYSLCSRYVKITGWGPKKICHYESKGTIGGILHSGLTCEDLYPIPITEQWLKDFGFEEREHSLFVKRIEEEALIPWVEAAIAGQDGVWVFAFRHTMIVKDLKHVHSLQNLFFSLTGTELKLENK